MSNRPTHHAEGAYLLSLADRLDVAAEEHRQHAAEFRRPSPLADRHETATLIYARIAKEIREVLK